LQALAKDKVAYEQVPVLDEKLARIEENSMEAAQLKKEREDLLRGARNAPKSFETQLQVNL
jgi:hypothetical protein